MSRVWMMCVGDRDPYYEKPRIPFNPQRVYNEADPNIGKGPILSLLESLPPRRGDRIYLIPTRKDFRRPHAERLKKDTDPGARATGEIIEQRYNVSVQYKPLVNLDPTDFEALIPAMRRILDGIIKESPPNADFIVFISSGTPQMQSTWYVLAHEGALPPGTRLYYRSMEGVPLREARIELLFEQESKRLAVEQARRFDFQATALTLEALAQKALEPQRRARAALLARLYLAYHAWILFDYKRTLQILDGLLQDPDSQTHLASLQLKEVIMRQRDVLEELNWVDAATSLESRAVDLYQAARLHLEMGRYADALWRAASCYEQVLVERAVETLYPLLGQRPNPYAFSESLAAMYRSGGSLPKTVEQLVRELYSQPIRVVTKRMRDGTRAVLDGVPLFLGVERARSILKRYNTNFDAQFVQQAQRDLLQARNDAVHRAEPVSAEEAKRGVNVAAQALRRQFDKRIQQKITDYPLSVETFREMARHLERIL